MKNKMIKNKYSNYQGFTLIELMVAMVIGVIVLLGLVSLFSNVSILNRAQNGLALLQENGRYAISRLKQDIENAGQKHCASVALPNEFVTNWNQGYEMKPLYVHRSTDLTGSDSTNGLPTAAQTQLDNVAGDTDQLGDLPVPTAYNIYPLDASYFLRGHDCDNSACTPAMNTVGSDFSADFRSPGIIDNSRLPFTDILTMRYVTGGTRVSAVAGNVLTTLNPIPDGSTGNALIADCNLSLVTPANWGTSQVISTVATPLPGFSLASNTSVYSMDRDFKTVSYFVGVDEDPNDSSRVVSSLYRSENGDVQQLVEGVERFDVFYLAQLQTGRVARLTAAQVETISGGGEGATGSIAGDLGCTLPATIKDYIGYHMPNDPGCLWRSIYAIEVNMLLNTVNDSSMQDDERYIYSIDSANPQDPTSGGVTGLPAERMYRKEFSAIVPMRNYTL